MHDEMAISFAHQRATTVALARVGHTAILTPALRTEHTVSDRSTVRLVAFSVADRFDMGLL